MQLELQMLDNKTLEELKSKHGAIADIDAPDGRTLVVRKAAGHVFTAFLGKVSKDGANRVGAMSDLARECVVYPADAAEVASILEAYPGLVLPLANAITEMAGATGEARIRKN